MTETLANGYSYESTQRELCNEYNHNGVSKVFKNICVLVKVASALEGLRGVMNLTKTTLHFLVKYFSKYHPKILAIKVLLHALEYINAQKKNVIFDTKILNKNT